jgi:hypothetical protein
VGDSCGEPGHLVQTSQLLLEGIHGLPLRVCHRQSVDTV